MLMRNVVASVVLIAGLLLLSSETTGAEEYRSPGAHFALVLPDGWVRMPPETVTAINNEVRQRMPNSPVQYEAGFQPRGQVAGTFPRILIQVQPMSTAGTSHEDFEREFAGGVKGKVQQVQGAFSDVAKNLSFGDIAFDWSSNRILIPVELDVAGTGKVRALSVGTMGSSEIVFLHCYAKQAEFDRNLPEFNAIIDSFHYDPGYTFVPRTSWSHVDFGGAIGGGIIGAIVGAIVGGIVGGVIFLLRKRAKRGGRT